MNLQLQGLPRAHATRGYQGIAPTSSPACRFGTQTLHGCAAQTLLQRLSKLQKDCVD